MTMMRTRNIALLYICGIVPALVLATGCAFRGNLVRQQLGMEQAQQSGVLRAEAGQIQAGVVVTGYKWAGYRTAGTDGLGGSSIVFVRYPDP